jgi:hypothetical protein
MGKEVHYQLLPKYAMFICIMGSIEVSKPYLPSWQALKDAKFHYFIV